MIDYEKNFLREIENTGQELPERIIANAGIQRYGRNNNCWYSFYLDSIPAGAFGDWSKGTSNKWSAKSVSAMSTAERDEYHRSIKKADEERERQQKEDQKQAARKAEQELENSGPASSDHPYLKKKQVKPHGLRQQITQGTGKLRPMLILEIKDEFGQITTYQTISPDGEKKLMRGGRKKGCFHEIGHPTSKILICEGWATGATLHEQTGSYVVVAIDAGNLQPVAEVIHRKHPDAEIIIAADDDWKTDRNPGLTKATAAAQAINAKLAVPIWTGDRPKESTDFNDLFIDEGKDSVLSSVQVAKTVESHAQRQGPNDSGSPDEAERSSASKKIVQLINSSCELFTDLSRTPFAKFTADRLVLPINAESFQTRIQAMCWDTREFVPSDTALRSALSTVKGKALTSGDERKVHVRVAHHESAYYIDLGNDSCNVINISPGQWTLQHDSPVMFHRPPNMRPLPTPENGGDVNLLWDFINIPEESRIMLLALLCEWMRENTTQPLLELVGEQGSGKSFASRCIRSLVDPNRVMLRTLRKAEDIFILAANNHLLTIENASKLNVDMQDSLCALSTGGGQASRKLYSDSEEYAIEARKPVLINGIGTLVTQPDLLDRTVSIILQRLDSRKVESELEANFKEALPKIFGGLLDLFAQTLKLLPTVHIDSAQLPRLGDFALLGEAVARATGKSPSTFLQIFNTMRDNAVLRILDGQPLGIVLLDYIDKHGDFRDGTMKQLHDQLCSFASEGLAKTLPKTPKSLADKLRQLSPSLLSAGLLVEIDPERKRDGFHLSVVRFSRPDFSQGYETFI